MLNKSTSSRSNKFLILSKTMGQKSETDSGFKLLNNSKRSCRLLNMYLQNNKDKLPTFSIDNLLPSLPLPALEHTLEKYLDSAKPVLTELEFLKTQKCVEDFKNGIGKALHFHLTQKAKKERNWLEKWWLQWAYLEFREPVVPYVNTSGFLVGHGADLKLVERLKSLNINPQAARAAVDSYSYNCFFEELRNEKFPIQRSRNQNFSMSQFRNFFNTCRIPGVGVDKLDIHFKTVKEGHCPTHFLVMYKNRFFQVSAYHRSTKTLLNPTELYHKINQIIKIYDKKSAGIGIGALTADNRDNWAKNRDYLIKLDSKNRKLFSIIEKAMYVINLDQDETLNADQIVNIAFLKNQKNRFSDKSYQLVVCKNGNVGSNVEHSPFDGMVSTTATVYGINKSKELNIDFANIGTMFPVRSDKSENQEPVELDFAYDLRIENEIERVNRTFEHNSSNIETSTLILTNCDKSTLKSYQINPDTFSQMCMQLAYYQLHNRPGTAYETATTRAFYHGRTETVRSCTPEAIEWCQHMCNPNSSLEVGEKLKLLKKACEKHDKLMSEARHNAGCDRHLLGLQLMARELKLDTPEIFTDVAWKKSGGGGNFLISSSCVGFTNVLGTCSPFCLNGYTMIYCFSDQGLAYSIAKYKASEETSLSKIKESLQSASIKMQKLFLSNSSKL